ALGQREPPFVVSFIADNYCLLSIEYDMLHTGSGRYPVDGPATLAHRPRSGANSQVQGYRYPPTAEVTSPSRASRTARGRAPVSRRGARLRGRRAAPAA